MSTNKTNPNSVMRGLRTPLPPGTVLGRLGGGHGPAYPVDINTLSQHVAKSGQVVTPGKLSNLKLSQLLDVSISSIATNQILHWNGSLWVNVDNTLAGLKDVDTTGVSTSNVLQFNGTKWVPATVGGTSTLGADTDVSLVSLTDKQALVYVASATKWENISLTTGYISDMVISSPADGDLLRYDSASGKWKNHQPAYYEWITMSGVTSAYTGLFATSGNNFILASPINLQSVTVVFQPLTGNTFQVIVCTINGSTKAITGTVAASSSFTMSVGTVQQHEFTFSSPVALSAGTWYAILFVLTNGTTTTTSGIKFVSTSAQPPSLPIDFGLMSNTGSSTIYWSSYANNSVAPTSVAAGATNTNAQFMMAYRWY